MKNVTEVRYAGYNADNGHSGSVINKTINGAGAATTDRELDPDETRSNPNGNKNINCGYSCDNNSNQGGWNRVEEIEEHWRTCDGAVRWHIALNVSDRYRDPSF